jgi:hypothetical protein
MNCVLYCKYPNKPYYSPDIVPIVPWMPLGYSSLSSIAFESSTGGKGVFRVGVRYSNFSN